MSFPVYDLKNETSSSEKRKILVASNLMHDNIAVDYRSTLVFLIIYKLSYITIFILEYYNINILYNYNIL